MKRRWESSGDRPTARCRMRKVRCTRVTKTLKGRNAIKGKDIMTKDVTTCAPDTTVAEAAHLMWDADGGILPVVDA